MKTLILASALFILSFTSSFAGNLPSDVLVNIDTRDNGSTKEYLHMVDNRPYARYVYEYDTDGKMINKVIQEWNEGKGVWVGIVRYDYGYGGNGKLSDLLFTRWNAKTESWSNTSELLVHVYDADGEFVTIKKEKVDNYNKMIAIR